jgi:hypothetical protein
METATKPASTPLPPLPWRAKHHEDWSEIVAADGTPLIAALPHLGGYCGKQAADMIVQAVNQQQATTQLLREMADVLQTCLQEDKISWGAEQDADVLLQRAQRLSA